MHVPVSRPLLDQREVELASKTVIEKNLSGFGGGYVTEFEEKFAAYCSCKYALTVNSGTTAIHLALAALGIKEGDEVLASTFTNMATFFAIMYLGAKPVPVDSELETLNMDVSLVEKLITSKTKAIIVVHIYGHPVDMDPILALAKKHKLFVIEDAAETHGAEYKGRRVGSLGDVGCFSFYANKIITTGEGGMVTMNDKALADRARLLKNLAFGDKNKFMHRALGFKYQMTNTQAAIGVAQMEKIEWIVERKREIAAFYNAAFAGIAEIVIPTEKEYAKNVYWMYNILLTGGLSGKRAQFMEELLKRGVETREDFVPFNLQEIFIKDNITQADACPVANEFSVRGLYLPSGNDISQEELEYVVQQVHEVVSILK
jgi:perosamine synthetase